jgi:hypothetical protein
MRDQDNPMQTCDILRQLDALIVSAKARLDDTTKVKILLAALPAIEEAVRLFPHEARASNPEDHRKSDGEKSL